MPSKRAAQLVFYSVSALVFAISAALTIAWCASMSQMGRMPMPGGWSMSMAWIRMPGETWVGATASFVGMWMTMMVAMMLPSLIRVGEAVQGRLTVLFLLGYFVVWAAVGTVVFWAGAVLTETEMQQPAVARFVPAAVAVIVLAAGVLQFTSWKARHLACCREVTRQGGALPADARRAWLRGVRFGVHCVCCSAGLTAILLALGVMDLWTMGAVMAGTTIERLATSADRSARAIGAVIIVAGVALIAHAMR